tara:strand:- start:289 stop:933 length:645 start_codon:yes stop_codon:yes gene_type:complete
MTTRKDAMSEYIKDIIFDIDDAKYMPSHLTGHGQAWLMSDQDYGGGFDERTKAKVKKLGPAARRHEIKHFFDLDRPVSHRLPTRLGRTVSPSFSVPNWYANVSQGGELVPGFHGGTALHGMKFPDLDLPITPDEMAPDYKRGGIKSLVPKGRLGKAFSIFGPLAAMIGAGFDQLTAADELGAGEDEFLRQMQGDTGDLTEEEMTEYLNALLGHD